MSPRSDCIFEIHQQWQSGFNRMHSNYCCSCSFEPEIIKIGQSSHKMYSNKILNFQGSTISNAHTKKYGNLLKARRIWIYMFIHICLYIYIYIYMHMYVCIYVYITCISVLLSRQDISKSIYIYIYIYFWYILVSSSDRYTNWQSLNAVNSMST